MKELPGRARYDFTTVWRISAPLEAVWEKIERTEEWPDWWKGVERVQRLAPGDPRTGIGAVRRFTWKSSLPYRLTFDMRATRIERYLALEGEAMGELEGRGCWAFGHAAGITTVTYVWQVRSNKRWMNLLSPLLRPAFEWNHDVVMAWGEKGLIRALKANQKALGSVKQKPKIFSR